MKRCVKIRLLPMRAFLYTLTLVSVAVWLLLAQCDKVNPFDLYHPPFIFCGFIGPDSTVLPGNFYYPNTASMIADTLRIFCYSSYYSEGRTNTGYQMRLDIYNPVNDTLFGIKNMLFRLANYDTNGFNRTYQLTPADSNNANGYAVQLTIKSFGVRSGAPLNISIPYLYPYQYPAYTAKRLGKSDVLTIVRAQIIGHMP